MFDHQKQEGETLRLYRSAVQCGKCYTVNVLFSLHALLIFCSHYMHLMSSGWVTASNFTCNITSNRVKLHTCNYTHFCVFACMVRVRCVDTTWQLRGHCVGTACNVRVVHAHYTRVMLQSLWPVLYIANYWNWHSAPQNVFSGWQHNSKEKTKSRQEDPVKDLGGSK